MNEDDLYRLSSQYRLWSFTPTALSDLRASTNGLACQRIHNATNDSGKSASSDNPTPHLLTPAEELSLVTFYCSRAMDFCDFCEFPTAVRATAVQFLRRFYTTHSPMSHHPKTLMPCAIFLATKTESHYINIDSFAAKLPKTSPEDVIRPELLLNEGMRFSFDVRHPYRALEGGTMEMNEIARGGYAPPQGSRNSSTEVRRRMLELGKVEKGGEVEREKRVLERIKTAHNNARVLLDGPGVLSDAYFLYTPSQIFLAALIAVDEELGLFYLHVLLSGTQGPGVKEEEEPSGLEAKVLGVLRGCSALLQDPRSGKPDVKEVKGALKEIDRKLKRVEKWIEQQEERDERPESVAGGGEKREEKTGMGTVEEKGGKGIEMVADKKVVKKRKLERDRARMEGEELFGGPLGK